MTEDAMTAREGAGILTNEEIEAALELAEKVTPGPWRTEDWGKGPFVTTIEEEPMWICDFGSACPEDGEFIALGRIMLPALARECLAFREATRDLIVACTRSRIAADRWRQINRFNDGVTLDDELNAANAVVDAALARLMALVQKTEPRP